MFCIFKTCIYENSLAPLLLFSEVNYGQHCKQSCTSTYWSNCGTVHQRKEILQHLASLNSYSEIKHGLKLFLGRTFQYKKILNMNTDLKLEGLMCNSAKDNKMQRSPL